ncbi:MAG: hypothetical protein IID12_06240 [Candidatus Marinimicrobia bacterium]|nr:hypothetical protein [Candidatus Neomarinimicrobiota bacterium]
MELSLFIKTLALGIFMSSSNMPGSPYDRVFDLSFQGDLLSASRVWERTNGIEYSGERIYAKSPKWNGALLELEHFRRSAQLINTQSSRLIYQFIGYEIVYFDYFKEEIFSGSVTPVRLKTSMSGFLIHRIFQVLRNPIFQSLTKNLSVINYLSSRHLKTVESKI